MLELMALFGLLVLGAAILALFAVAGFFLKVVFKVLLLPFSLLFVLLKGLFLLLLFVIGLVLAPIVVVLLVIALPLFFLLGLAGLGWAAAAA